VLGNYLIFEISSGLGYKKKFEIKEPSHSNSFLDGYLTGSRSF
jgi:hypothetical protein